MNSLPKKKILFLSNDACDYGRKGLNFFNSLRKRGHEIDYLSLYPVEGHPEVLSVYKKKNSVVKSIHHFFSRVFWHLYKKYVSPESKYAFFNKSDLDAPVSPDLIFSQLGSDYDILMVYFWQAFLTPYTIQAVVDKYAIKKVFFLMADYAAMTGGCHYTVNCERYKIGCGMCPAWRSNNECDVTRQNTLLRKQIYDKINPIITGNTHMQEIYRSSFLFKGRTYMKTYGTLDLNHFRKIDRTILRKKYEIPEHKKKIIFFGCQSLLDPKKGISMLIEALNQFSQRLSTKEKNEILLLVAGRSVGEVLNSLPFDYKFLGFIPYTNLPEVFSLSTCFVSPSINDAGPSMVSQSLACGTPVVSFNIGIALDCIKTGETGYLAEIGNVTDLSSGIEYILKMNQVQYAELQNNCITKAHKLFSIDKSIENFEKHF